MELDRRLKTTRKKISRTMLYSVVTRNSQCRIYRVSELDGRLKTDRYLNMPGLVPAHALTRSRIL